MCCSVNSRKEVKFEISASKKPSRHIRSLLKSKIIEISNAEAYDMKNIKGRLQAKKNSFIRKSHVLQYSIAKNNSTIRHHLGV